MQYTYLIIRRATYRPKLGMINAEEVAYILALYLFNKSN